MAARTKGPARPPAGETVCTLPLNATQEALLLPALEQQRRALAATNLILGTLLAGIGVSDFDFLGVDGPAGGRRLLYVPRAPAPPARGAPAPGASASVPS